MDSTHTHTHTRRCTATRTHTCTRTRRASLGHRDSAALTSRMPTTTPYCLCCHGRPACPASSGDHRGVPHTHTHTHTHTLLNPHTQNKLHTDTRPFSQVLAGLLCIFAPYLL